MQKFNKHFATLLRCYAATLHNTTFYECQPEHGSEIFYANVNILPWYLKYIFLFFFVLCVGLVCGLCVATILFFEVVAAIVYIFGLLFIERLYNYFVLSLC